MNVDRFSRDSSNLATMKQLLRVQSEVNSLISTLSPSDALVVETNEPVSEKHVRNFISHRLNRQRIFGNELFADPAWDMLLELYACRLGQRRISVSSLCIASAVPATTALRWVKKLEDDQWIDREPDPLDARRYFVTLSEKGTAAMQKFFSSAKGTFQ